MAYRDGHSPRTNEHTTHVNGHGLQTVYVHLTPQFTGKWGNGRYSGVLTILERYFEREMRLGYIDMDEDRQIPRLRFPERSVVIPLHSTDSMTSAQANGFYHTRKVFQPSKKKMKPASINGKIVEPGAVRVWWEIMY